MVRAGIDIGGTKVIIGFVGDGNQVLYRKKVWIPEEARGENFVPWLAEGLKAAAQGAAIPYTAISYCGVGVPGTVSRDGKVVLKAPNLHWENEPLSGKIKAATGITARLVQDARGGAWGEYIAGAGQGHKNILCITLGTGIGTGIVLDGKIFQGSLACAGEIGHVPVGSKGRKCGCGKVDCLEKYAAGMGFDLTAKELFGETSGARDLFDKAREGNAFALEAIAEAVSLLGQTLVSAINLLSPDCLLFSGGLSQEEALYINPLIRYIKEHSYSLTGDQMDIGLAALGEDAPMIGCALLPCEEDSIAPQISASIMCADFMHLEKVLRELEENKLDFLHCDIMDNHFVPNLMLPMELLNKIHENTMIPYDVHIMAQEPSTIIERLVFREGDTCIIHYESTPHLQRTLSLIREKKAKPGVALNPATSIEVIREVLEEIEVVLIMTVNPGFSGQPLLPQAMEKIARARHYLDALGYQRIRIEVDGNCSFVNIPKMRAAGADTFVVGSSSLFHPHSTMKEAMVKIKNSLVKE